MSKPWHFYLDSEAPGRRSGDLAGAAEAVYNDQQLGAGLLWASRMAWGAGYFIQPKDNQYAFAEFQAEVNALGYQLSHIHRGKGDATMRFRVQEMFRDSPNDQERNVRADWAQERMTTHSESTWEWTCTRCACSVKPVPADHECPVCHNQLRRSRVTREPAERIADIARQSSLRPDFMQLEPSDFQQDGLPGLPQVETQGSLF